MNTETVPDRPASPYVIDGIPGLLERAGSPLGTSRWVTVDQEMVTAFAEVSSDRQWIHIDPERAGQSPYGTTIVHGFFTLSLSTHLLDDIFSVKGVAMTLNYGLNRVRFPSPVRANSLVRARFRLQTVRKTADATEAVFSVLVEEQGVTKPCCAAEWIVRYFQ